MTYLCARRMLIVSTHAQQHSPTSISTHTHTHTTFKTTHLSFLLVNPFKHASFHPHSSTTQSTLNFQMTPLYSTHSTSLVCSSIPFIVHLIDVNHLHKSFVLVWTLTQHPSHTFNHFQSIQYYHIHLHYRLKHTAQYNTSLSHITISDTLSRKLHTTHPTLTSWCLQ